MQKRIRVGAAYCVSIKTVSMKFQIPFNTLIYAYYWKKLFSIMYRLVFSLCAVCLFLELCTTHQYLKT